jgi:hypothetical protein
MKKGVVGLPRLLILFRILMQQCKQTCVSIAQLEIRFNLCRGSIWDIVHECLGYRKVCSSWVPRQLTDELKKTRMGSSLMLLQRYEEHGEAFLSRTVTGDGTWVFHYTPESKAKSMTWKHPEVPTTVKDSRCRLLGCTSRTNLSSLSSG